MNKIPDPYGQTNVELSIFCAKIVQSNRTLNLTFGQVCGWICTVRFTWHLVRLAHAVKNCNRGGRTLVFTVIQKLELLRLSYWSILSNITVCKNTYINKSVKSSWSSGAVTVQLHGLLHCSASLYYPTRKNKRSTPSLSL